MIKLYLIKLDIYISFQGISRFVQSQPEIRKGKNKTIQYSYPSNFFVVYSTQILRLERKNKNSQRGEYVLTWI